MPADRSHVHDNLFDLHQIAAAFPSESSTLLIDRYLVRNPSASARIFRVYRGTPAHYHQNCDEFLYVLSGKGTVWIGEPANIQQFQPGHLLAFPRRTVHAMPELLELPVVFLSVDVPPRDPTDIIFVDLDQATPQQFIRELTAKDQAY